MPSKRFSRGMSRNFGKYSIPTYFKPTNTLRQLLVKPKDPVSKENVVGPVYKIKCEECETMYIGKTEKSLKSRLNEHRRHSSTTSKVAKHIHLEQLVHSVELENTKILTIKSRWFERGVKEAIYIRALNPSLHRDASHLPPVWDNIIQERVKAEKAKEGEGGSLPPSRTSPTTSLWQCTDESYSSQCNFFVSDVLSCDN